MTEIESLEVPDSARNGEESKREAFVRLATRRTNSVLDRIRILSNCANTNAYDYTDDDVRKIFSAIDEELRVARSRFQGSKKREFKLVEYHLCRRPPRFNRENETVATKSAPAPKYTPDKDIKIHEENAIKLLCKPFQS